MEIPSERIDSIFREWDNDESPGCALAIIHDGQVAYARGYGMANLEHGIPITTGSIFHIASISKQFTDMCVALLAADGSISLDDDIRRHVPEIPDFGQTITIRHLIHHTSGLRDMWDLLRMAGWRADDLITENDMLWVSSRQSAPNFQPGDEYLYSNTGYALLALIVHRVSGKTLRTLAQERIFEPLSMASTHFHDNHSEIVKGRTQAYEPTPDGGLKISIPVFDVVGTTSLFTTVEDMARWDDNFNHRRVGGDDIIEQMLTPGTLNNNVPMTYGFGLQVHAYRGLPIVEHSGADAGYRAHYLRFPEERLAIVCLCNLSTMMPRNLALDVADILLADTFPESIVDDTRTTVADDERRVVGVYLDRTTGDLLRVTHDAEGLWLGFQDPQRLEPLAGGEYRVQGQRLTRLQFEISDGVQHLISGAIHSAVADQRFQRVAGPEEASVPQVSGGDYYSNEVATTYWLEPDGSRLRLKHYRLDDRMLHHAYDDVFAGNNLRLQLERDGAGEVSGFTLSTFRVRNVSFRRC